MRATGCKELIANSNMLDTCSLEDKKVLDYNGQPWNTLINAIETRFPR